MSGHKEKLIIVSEGKRFRECIQQTKTTDGAWVTQTYHQEKRNGQWIMRKSPKAYNQSSKRERH